jgi:signal transduction histidine kinase
MGADHDEVVVISRFAHRRRGIAKADQEHIFEKFRQVDGSLTRQTQGTGLGLAISRELAILLSGQLGLESESDKGSTFWLDIPVDLAKEPSAAGE